MTVADVPVFLRSVNPRKQGDSGMGIAIGWFACAGYTVCVPLTDSQPYDLIVDDGEHGLQRVSVKTTTRTHPNGTYRVGLRTQGGNKSQFKIRPFDQAVVDLLFVACDNGDRFLLPVGEFQVTNEITLGMKYEQFRI
jgi:PD-(D/E)XK endonuclease